MQDESRRDSWTIYERKIGRGGKTVKTYRFEQKEIISEEYEVIGAKSASHAQELITEYGEMYEQDGVTIQKVDESWNFHKAFKPVLVKTLVSSPCTFYGRVWEKRKDNLSEYEIKNNWGWMANDCDSVLEGEAGGVCRRCMESINKGFSLRPLPTEEN